MTHAQGKPPVNHKATGLDPERDVVLPNNQRGSGYTRGARDGQDRSQSASPAGSRQQREDPAAKEEREGRQRQIMATSNWRSRAAPVTE